MISVPSFDVADNVLSRIYATMLVMFVRVNLDLMPTLIGIRCPFESFRWVGHVSVVAFGLVLDRKRGKRGRL